MSRRRWTPNKADWIILVTLSAFAIAIFVTDMLILSGKIG